MSKPIFTGERDSLRKEVEQFVLLQLKGVT